MGSSHSAQPKLPPSISIEVSPARQVTELPAGQDEQPEAIGESGVRRHFQFADHLVDIPFSDEPEVNTVFAIWARAVKRYHDNPAFGQRAFLPDGSRGEYEWETYSQVHEQVLQLAAGLKKLGVEPNDKVGILSINRPEWVKSLLAMWSQSAVCVPLYDTLGANAVRFILENGDVKIVFTSKAKASTIFEHVDEVDSVTHVIQFEEIGEDQQDAVKALKKPVMSFRELIELGKENPVDPSPPEPSTLAYIMYTSGTTGDPKGVLLSHRNITASTAGLFHSGASINSDDVYLSYLPLAHSFETILQVFGMCGGARVGFYQGDVKQLTNDIMCLRPTVFAGVPRVYTRIYDKIQQQLGESWLKKSLFETAFEAQVANVRKGERSGFWDALVFNKVKGRLGGRMRMMASGAAPLPSHIHEFLKVAFGCEVIQGYGMTENAAAAVASPPGYNRVGSVGCPLPCTEVKLVDVPEMNYRSTDELPRGEVCLRGSNVFEGYYKLEDKTKETLDSDGWLFTGDIGRFNEDGSLSIIDRKKNIFKLAQGEFVAAEEVEGILGKSPFVTQIFVYGDSEQTCVVAIVVPDPGHVKAWAAENKIEGDFATVAGSEEFKKAAFEDMVAKGKEAKLASFKIPKAIHIETEVNDQEQGFTVENDCLTPTFKLKRPQLKKRYLDAIHEMYKSLSDA